MDYITGASYDQVRNMYAEKGYRFYEGEKYHINLCGFRNKDLITVDKFNDWLGVAYTDDWGNKHFLLFAATTKPGLVNLQGKPQNPKGTFIMCPGQHLNAWEMGYHHPDDPVNRYEAFHQSGNGVFRGWRDEDGDGKFDFDGPIYTDCQGVNGHRASIADRENVGPYGNGCQVVKDDKEFLIWLSIGKRCAELYGIKFHYTLFQLQ